MSLLKWFSKYNAAYAGPLYGQVEMQRRAFIHQYQYINIDFKTYEQMAGAPWRLKQQLYKDFPSSKRNSFVPRSS